MENGKGIKNLENDDDINVYNDEMYMLGDVKECEEEENESENDNNKCSNGINTLNNNNMKIEKITLPKENNNEEKEKKNFSLTKLNYNNQNPNKFSFNQSNNNEEEEEEEENSIPLISLKFLSKCQCCQNIFNDRINIPYLFKCGHFFCKKCIEENFTDEEGIKCPNDGLVAYSLKELKILNNLINDNKYIESSNRNEIFCHIHKEQKLTHFIEKTKEIICVYCAFEKCKKNPNCEIKEIKDIYYTIHNNIDNIINDYQNYSDFIQQSLNIIKNNKENEERKIEIFFDKIISNLTEKKIEIFNQVEFLYNENIRKFNQELNLFSNLFEECENLKNEIENSKNNFLDILDNYNKIKSEIKDYYKIKIHLNESKFIFEQDNKILNIINTLFDLKIIPKFFSFNGIKEINEENKKSTINNKNNNDVFELEEYNNSINSNSNIQNENKNNLFNSFNIKINKFSFSKPIKNNSRLYKK